jgi:hypothetical protein
MSDDLVKRLRKIGDRVAIPCPDNIKGCAVFHFRIETDPTCKEAADHIQELEAKLEQIETAWNMALYGDLEHGVASLNEKAHRAFNKGYPNIAAFGSNLVRILYEGEKE